MASDMDEILKEEIREYKETLTCPSCKVTVRISIFLYSMLGEPGMDPGLFRQSRSRENLFIGKAPRSQPVFLEGAGAGKNP